MTKTNHLPKSLFMRILYLQLYQGDAPMAEISSAQLSLLVDGKTIEVKNKSKLNFELNKALNSPDQFQDFAKNPAAFARKFDLEIDEDISSKLSSKLSGIKSLAELKSITDNSTVAATAWAVVSGAYSMASTKIAVAFAN